MTLTTGTLYLKGDGQSSSASIENEIEGTRSGNFALKAGAIDNADDLFSGDSMRDFAGYTHNPDPPTNAAGTQTNLDCNPLDCRWTWTNPTGTPRSPDGYRCEYQVNTGSWNFEGNDTASPFNGFIQSAEVVDFDTVNVRVRSYYNTGGTSAFSTDSPAFNAQCGGDEK